METPAIKYGSIKIRILEKQLKAAKVGRSANHPDVVKLASELEKAKKDVK